MSASRGKEILQFFLCSLGAEGLDYRGAKKYVKSLMFVASSLWLTAIGFVLFLLLPFHTMNLQPATIYERAAFRNLLPRVSPDQCVLAKSEASSLSMLGRRPRSAFLAAQKRSSSRKASQRPSGYLLGLRRGVPPELADLTGSRCGEAHHGRLKQLLDIVTFHVSLFSLNITAPLSIA